MNDLHWSRCPLVVVDVEGNGQSPPEIVELASVRVSDREIGCVRTWVLRPSSPITAHATSIHGISNDEVAAYPAWQAVSSDIRRELDGRVVIGHQVSVDARLIKRAEPDWKPLALIDTIALAKKVAPGEPSYALDSLVRRLLPDVGEWRRHRAKGDALVTAALFLKLAHLLEQKVDLTLLALAQMAGAADDNYLRSRQGGLFR